MWTEAIPFEVQRGFQRVASFSGKALRGHRNLSWGTLFERRISKALAHSHRVRRGLLSRLIDMSTSETWRFLKAIVPKVPLISKTAIYHALGVSENCKDWDLKTELTVNVLRSFIMTPSRHGVLQSQKVITRDPGIKGKMWISKVTMPKPDDDGIRQALFEAIGALDEEQELAKAKGAGGLLFTEPELRPVEAEWTGYRAEATKNSPELRISEAEKYDHLMKEVSSPTTILYCHGGAYYLCDPATHRSTTTMLAKLTKGRCLSVRYRLAPQNPFPAALLDALVVYFSLLYAPPGSLHSPVPASHIVFSGDSAGGNLICALLHTLMQFRRMNFKIRWNGEDRDVPLPAGVAGNSPWLDVTHCLPSNSINGKYDYLPSREVAPKGFQFPPDSVWPANPPRRNLYAEDRAICHPLVSPIAAQWEGSCPIFFVTGQELLADESKYVAMIAARAGVKVVYEEFEAMPHCFALVLEGSKAAERCYEEWAKFITAAVERPETLKTAGLKYGVKTLAVTEVDVEKLIPFTIEEVRQRMKERVKELDPSHPDSLVAP